MQSVYGFVIINKCYLSELFDIIRIDKLLFGLCQEILLCVCYLKENISEVIVKVIGIRREHCAEDMGVAKSRSLHSPQDGIRLPKDKKRGTGDVTHEYRDAFGWRRKN